MCFFVDFVKMTFLSIYDKMEVGISRRSIMKISTRIVRDGYDGKKCLVHARTCVTPNGKVIGSLLIPIYLKTEGGKYGSSNAIWITEVERL